MATTPQTRAALAEIPLRMGMLRVSQDFNRLEGEDQLNNTFPSIMNATQATTSPDEIVIRQRGRRKISIAWTPEKNQIATNKTPVKLGTSMQLRSSPRKRLLLHEFSLTPQRTVATVNLNASLPNFVASPKKNDVNAIVSKRARMEVRPIAQTHKDTPLSTTLQGLSQSQLIDLIQSMVQEHPTLEQRVRGQLPMPDLRPMEVELANSRKNIYKSLPTSRLVKKTDCSAYARASSHLAVFKKVVTDHVAKLSDSKNWDALIDYIMMAWGYVKATPLWDNKTHNQVRNRCFVMLAFQLREALKNGGILLGEERLTALAEQINTMSSDCEDICASFVQLENILKDLNCPFLNNN